MMKIIDNEDRKYFFFEEVKVATVFKYSGKYYIKSDNIDSISHEQVYALNLETGKTKCFAKNDKVLVCEAELYIE